MQTLLAKSAKAGRPPKTLPAHTSEVLTSVQALFGTVDSPTRLGLSWLGFFQVSAEERHSFYRHLRVAVAFHDVGKANDGFQAAVCQRGNPLEQVIRHEHLSGLLLCDERMIRWLRESELDFELLLAAVISHHVKVSEKNLGQFRGIASVIRLLTDNDDFRSVWNTVLEEVRNGSFAFPPMSRRWSRTEIGNRVDALLKLLQRERTRLRNDLNPARRRMLNAVRSALIVSDAVGSAVMRLPEDLEPWVRSCFACALAGDDIEANVIERRIEQLRATGRWDDRRGLSEFQRGITDQGSRVLLTTPCGSGKTLAAWNWIKTQLNHRPAARVIFLYPTRATATEGFRDYVSWAPETDAGLLTGTAAYELEEMFDSPDDLRGSRDYRVDERLYALGHWRKRIFSATADQFFPFMQYAYGPLCLLPLLAESVLVVDEVHSFDKSMFSTLKHFLREFPIPVLCMTATLAAERRRDLEECGLRHYPDIPIVDLDAIAKHARYQVEWIDREQAAPLAREALDERRRVLWVCNRVEDCQRAFDAYREDDGYIGTDRTLAYCYHSRFKLDDRRERHKDLVECFQYASQDDAKPQGILGATTQVCEMSLDLDAEVLITELAPIASLIQRMGRCNRDFEKMKTRPLGRVYVVRQQAGREKPYEKQELDVAARFVDEIAGRALSQHDLELAYAIHDSSEVEPYKHCPFLDSGPFAMAHEVPFRDIDEFTVPCVLDYDVENVVSAIRRREPIDGFLLPVPRYLAANGGAGESRLPRWLSIAPGRYYDKLAGFRAPSQSFTNGSGER